MKTDVTLVGYQRASYEPVGETDHHIVTSGP